MDLRPAAWPNAIRRIRQINRICTYCGLFVMTDVRWAIWQQGLPWYLHNNQTHSSLQAWPVQSLPSGKKFVNTSHHVVCLMAPSVANYHNNIVTAWSLAITQLRAQPSYQIGCASRLFTIPQHSSITLIRTLVIRIANYPYRLGPSGKHFLTVIVPHLSMA